MPDLQQIKEASDAAAFGSFASEVVLAITRFRSGHDRPTDPSVLRQAADLLESLSEPARRSRVSPGVQSLAGLQTAQSAVKLALDGNDSDAAELLRPLTEATRALADGLAVDRERVDRVISVFSLITDLQLARVNESRMNWTDRSPWTATQLT